MEKRTTQKEEELFVFIQLTVVALALMFYKTEYATFGLILAFLAAYYLIFVIFGDKPEKRKKRKTLRKRSEKSSSDDASDDLESETEKEKKKPKKSNDDNKESENKNPEILKRKRKAV